MGFSPSRLVFASLYGLPDTPTANILHFLAILRLDLVPIKNRNAYSITQILDIKDFAERKRSDVVTGVRWNPIANNWHASREECEVDEIALRKGRV